MSNSRRLRRAGATRRANAQQILTDAVRRHPDMVAESVATLNRPTKQAVTEAGVVEAPRADRPGRMLIQLIKAGWSLNDSYYSAKVLRRDGPRAFPAGTQAFIDHATDLENEERPVGSITRLAAVQTTDARWDQERNALVAEVRLFEPWRKTLTDMHEHIGMSIRAWVLGEYGQAEGREGFIVSELAGGRSVDFVTVPAAGGKVLAVLESAQAKPAVEARNVGAWLESRLHLALTQLGDNMYGDGRLTRQERIVLSGAIGDALQAWTARVEADAPQLFERDLYDEPPEAERSAEEAATDDTRAMLQRAIVAAYSDDDGRCMTWVMDFDPDAGLVWYSDDERHWQQGYSISDRQITLADDRVEVTRRTVYEPVPDSTGEAAPAPVPDPEPAADTAPETETAPTDTASAGEAAPEVEPLAVAEMVTDLARLDRLLGHTPQDVPAVAGAGQNAEGAPPTAQESNPEGATSMSGDNTGARAPDQAGTATEAAPTTPVAASEAQVAVIAQERDQYRSRAHSLAEALTEAQNAQRRAEAERAEAVADRNRLRANEAGRQTVDRLLADPKSGVPDNLAAHIAPRVHAAVHNQVPLTDAGEVNQEALDALVATAIRTERVHAAQLLEAQGVGSVRGLGAEGDPTMQMTAEQFDKQVAGLFTDIGLDESTTKLATKGR